MYIVHAKYAGKNATQLAAEWKSRLSDEDKRKYTELATYGPYPDEVLEMRVQAVIRNVRQQVR